VSDSGKRQREERRLIYDERQLVDRCLAGEQAAIAELIERFRTPVFGLAYRMLGHRHDAEDVSQESFVRAIRSLKNWDCSRALLPWLLAIVGNRCKTLMASRRRHPQHLESLDQISDGKPDPNGQHLAEEVQLALVGLRGEYRQAFLLFHDQQMSYDEIARTMAKPLGTIKTWVHRARRDLVKHLQARGVVEVSTDAMR
jgi:RNA polymerase sigma-70 factor, ECF subfamily